MTENEYICVRDYSNLLEAERLVRDCYLSSEKKKEIIISLEALRKEVFSLLTFTK